MGKHAEQFVEIRQNQAYLFRGRQQDCLARFAADMGLAGAPREIAPAGRRARGTP